MSTKAIIQEIIEEQINPNVPDFRPGDTVRVHQLIKEGNKERVQVFEGVVIARKGSQSTENFTVRKISHNVGVEKVFPVHSPRIQKIEIKQTGKVRRAKLYYLRELTGKKSKLKQRNVRDSSAAKA